MPKDYQEVERIMGEFETRAATLEIDYTEIGHGYISQYQWDTLSDWLRTALTTYGNARELEGVEKEKERVKQEVDSAYKYMADLIKGVKK